LKEEDTIRLLKKVPIPHLIGEIKLWRLNSKDKRNFDELLNANGWKRSEYILWIHQGGSSL
jgi:hypothetical protein